MFPRAESRQRSSWAVVFDGANLLFDDFAAAIAAAGAGRLLGGNGNLLVIGSGQTLTLKMQGNVELDLQQKGRFALVQGGTLQIEGASTHFTIKNGQGQDSPANAGGIRIDGGSTRIHNITLEFNSCTAYFAAGMYLVAGILSVQSSELLFESCIATDKGGGGLSIYMGDVNVSGTGSCIRAVNCKSGSQGGGMINYGGTINLGDTNFLEAVNCSAGNKDPLNGFGGGISIGDSYNRPGEMMTPSLRMTNGAFIRAEACQSWRSAAISFTNAIIGYSPASRIIATRNVAIGPANGDGYATLPSSSAVYLYQTKLLLNDVEVKFPNPSVPISVTLHQNMAGGELNDTATTGSSVAFNIDHCAALPATRRSLLALCCDLIRQSENR